MRPHIKLWLALYLSYLAGYLLGRLNPSTVIILGAGFALGFVWYEYAVHVTEREP